MQTNEEVSLQHRAHLAITGGRMRSSRTSPLERIGAAALLRLVAAAVIPRRVAPPAYPFVEVKVSNGGEGGRRVVLLEQPRQVAKQQ